MLQLVLLPASQEIEVLVLRSDFRRVQGRHDFPFLTELCVKVSGVVLFVTSNQDSTECEPVVPVRRFLPDLVGWNV